MNKTPESGSVTLPLKLLCVLCPRPVANYDGCHSVVVDFVNKALGKDFSQVIQVNTENCFFPSEDLNMKSTFLGISVQECF